MRTFAKWREEMRDFSSRVYGYVRLWSLEVARRLVAMKRLGAPEEIWHLRYDEALALVDGTLDRDDAARRIAHSQEYQASYRAYTPPNEIGSRYAVKQRAPIEVAAGGSVLAGIGGSAGVYTGRARVIRRVEEATGLERGEILVTHFTDPGWTPLLNQASAVITEVGGLLSHAAVIAREYGIPAVLAIGGATDRIPNGATVTVDGVRGTVVVHGPPSNVQSAAGL
jgi:pyruvate,water dikinase